MGWKIISDTHFTKTYHGARRRVYKALCDCGNEFFLRKDFLYTFREPKSCGQCSKSTYNILQNQEEIEKEQKKQQEAETIDVMAELLKNEPIELEKHFKLKEESQSQSLVSPSTHIINNTE